MRFTDSLIVFDCPWIVRSVSSELAIHKYCRVPTVTQIKCNLVSKYTLQVDTFFFLYFFKCSTLVTLSLLSLSFFFFLHQGREIIFTATTVKLSDQPETHRQL